jgi:hypothetical protein
MAPTNMLGLTLPGTLLASPDLPELQVAPL